METSELFCLLCNTKLEVTCGVNIFYTSLSKNGMQLGTFISQVLHCLESDLRSSYVCIQCFSLFQMLEQAQWSAANIRNEILHAYEISGKCKDDKITTTVNSDLIEIDDKSFAKKLSQQDKLESIDTIGQLKNTNVLKITSIEECSTIQNNYPACKKSDTPNRDASLAQVDLHQNSNNFVKPDIENLILLNQGPDNSTNQQHVRYKRKFRVKVESADLDNGNNNCQDLSSDELSTEVMNASREILKKGDVTDTAKTKIKSKLNRQEKMALYRHQCRVCGRLFKHANHLNSHSLKHWDSKPYECRICHKSFLNLSDAKFHAIQEHPRYKYTIDIAPETQKNEQVDFIEDDHGLLPEELLGMSDHEEQDDFEWKEGGASTEKVTEDGKGVSGKDPLEMLDTLKESTSDSSKITPKSRKMLKYNSKPLKYPCPTCGKKWRTPAELRTHLKSHSNLRPYMCEKCGQAYKHKYALEVHVGMHNGINPFQCSFCNKCFTQKGALIRHLPMHTGETPYQCELCGKRFVHHTSYNMHALSHTGKKSHQCHVCDLALLSTSHLKRHMRVHTGEKPYSCTLCGKRFAERYNLFAHQKIHDPVEILAKESKKIQYKCEQCAIIFDKKQKLDDHLKLHNNGDIVTDSTTTKKWESLTLQNQSHNENAGNLDPRENISADQAWGHVGYAKLQSIGNDPKLGESQNPFQIVTTPVATVIENHKMLIDLGCNRNLIPNLSVLSGNQMSLERTEI
ncbi:zinc finger protein 37-like [Athalia rosae]|uniref:zinc finger protein 37-like n=1 Tax=Athalia rosae TaxID=37344 RepID=UPI002033E6E8|nr:zinc finger protein 37-like [Athalia rosae]